MRRLPLLLIALLGTTPLHAQTAPNTDFGVFNRLVGSWEGDAWQITGPGPRHDVWQRERVESVAGGTVIAVQGLGIERLADGTSKVVHDAFATIYRDREGRPAMRAFLANGQWIDADLTISDSGYVWQMTPVPNVRMRYVMTMGADGQWVERGFQRYAEQPERQVFEMTLRRVPGPPPLRTPMP